MADVHDLVPLKMRCWWCDKPLERAGATAEDFEFVRYYFCNAACLDECRAHNHLIPPDERSG